jgi:hypothetical protein
MTKKKVARCNIWRMGRMDNRCGFGSGNFLSGPFGIVSSCIVGMQIDTSMALSATALIYRPFEVRKNRWAKELCIVRQPSRQCKKTADARRQPNTGNQAFFRLNWP